MKPTLTSVLIVWCACILCSVFALQLVAVVQHKRKPTEDYDDESEEEQEVWVINNNPDVQPEEEKDIIIEQKKTAALQETIKKLFQRNIGTENEITLKSLFTEFAKNFEIQQANILHRLKSLLPRIQTTPKKFTTILLGFVTTIAGRRIDISKTKELLQDLLNLNQDKIQIHIPQDIELFELWVFDLYLLFFDADWENLWKELRMFQLENEQLFGKVLDDFKLRTLFNQWLRFSQKATKTQMSVINALKAFLERIATYFIG